MEHDVDVSDIENEDGIITVLAPHTEYFKTKTALTEAFTDITIDVDEITFIPQIHVDLSGDDVELFDKFIDMLNDCDDVQEVYHNAILPSE